MALRDVVTMLRCHGVTLSKASEPAILICVHNFSIPSPSSPSVCSSATSTKFSQLAGPRSDIVQPWSAKSQLFSHGRCNCHSVHGGGCHFAHFSPANFCKCTRLQIACGINHHVCSGDGKTPSKTRYVSGRIAVVLRSPLVNLFSLQCLLEVKLLHSYGSRTPSRQGLTRQGLTRRQLSNCAILKRYIQPRGIHAALAKRTMLGKS